MTSLHTNLLRSAIALALATTPASAEHAATVRVDTVAVTAAAPAQSPSGRYLVTFEEPGLVDYDGGVTGIAATAPKPAGAASRKFDATSFAAASYSVYLASRRETHLARIERTLGRALQVRHRYDVARHGVSLALSQDEAAVVAGLAGVRSVVPVRVFPLTTYRGPAFIGAGAIWTGAAAPSGNGTRGEGIRIGIIDAGTDPSHPSFANAPACGFSATRPKLVSKDCSFNTGAQCGGNTPQPDPGVGHGMHVASTAAGNPIDAQVDPAPLLPEGMGMSGVAPCAEVIGYKVCDADGCSGDAIEAAVQNAIADQVDVINFSIGPTCGGGDPWGQDLAFLAAFASDVVVVAAAGNTDAGCPDPTGLVSNLAPWVTTVAATTHDTHVGTELSVTGPGTPPALLQDIALRPGSTTRRPADTEALFNALLRADPTNLIGCTDSGGIEPHAFDDAIAVVQRGTCSFNEKIVNATAAGARMVIVVNNVEGAFGMDTTGVPDDVVAFNISDLAASEALLAHIQAAGNPPLPPDGIFVSGFEPVLLAFATYLPAAVSHQQGDVLASFSLRGPVSAPLADLAKPDIAAPGDTIYAASESVNGHYEFQSGTSMASPHVAGAAVLVRALHPDWTVSDVKSALMSTAQVVGVKEDRSTPWDADDIGSGRVDLNRAALAGLTLEESQANYLAASPGGSIALTELNLPSLRNMRCGERCSWTRTVTNRLNEIGHWTISSEDPPGYGVGIEPAIFTLAPGASQSITITATIDDVTLPVERGFGRIWLREDNALAPPQQFPLSLQGDEVSAACDDGYCNFRVDNFTAGYSAIGCGSGCSLLWANRFSPPASDFPIALTAVSFLTGGPAYVSAGDRYDIYIYQDDDRDPTNGAALVGSYKGYEIVSDGARLRAVPLPEPIVVNGAGDVIVVMTNPSGTGPRPAGGEISLFRGRSYTGTYAGEDPDLGSAVVNLRLNPDAIDSQANYVIRAIGTNAAGKRVDYGAPHGSAH